MILLDESFWEVKKTKDRGNGLFSRKDISAGVVIGDYLGQVIKTAEYDFAKEEENLYLMYYHDYASIYPNLDRPGVYLLNHSCMPNCFMYTHQGHTLFFALRHIFAGEELTISYQFNPKRGCNPCSHVCKCNTLLCNRTMHLSESAYTKWRTFQDEREKKDKRKRIRYGKDLPPLSSYPTEILDNPIYSLFGNTTQPSKKISGTKIPSSKKMREIIRKIGRTIELPEMKIKIYGVQNDIPLYHPHPSEEKEKWY